MRTLPLLLLGLICFSDLFFSVQTETLSQIHLLESPALYAHKSEVVGNLRTHDAYSSGANSIGGAFLGFIFGPILFFMSFIFIWFN